MAALEAELGSLRRGYFKQEKAGSVHASDMGFASLAGKRDLFLPFAKAILVELRCLMNAMVA